MSARRGGSEPEVTFDITLGSEIRFSLRTENQASAKRRHAAASAQLDDALAAIRNGNKWLSQKERVAFGGLVYDEFVKGFGDFPGDPKIWQLVREVHEKASLTPECRNCSPKNTGEKTNALTSARSRRSQAVDARAADAERFGDLRGSDAFLKQPLNFFAANRLGAALIDALRLRRRDAFSDYAEPGATLWGFPVLCLRGWRPRSEGCVDFGLGALWQRPGK